MGDHKTAVPACLGLLAVICLGVSLAGFGWWSYKANVTVLGCSGSLTIDICPLGVKSGGTASCSSNSGSSSASLTKFSDGSAAKSNGDVALGLTIAGAALALGATVVHGMGKNDHPVVPFFFFVAGVLGAVAVGYFLENNQAVVDAKKLDTKDGFIGVGGILAIVGTSLCFLGMLSSCFVNGGRNGYRRI
jgi:hypothetical protein